VSFVNPTRAPPRRIELMSEVQVNLPTLAKKFRLHRTPPWALLETGTHKPFIHTGVHDEPPPSQNFSWLKTKPNQCSVYVLFMSKASAAPSEYDAATWCGVFAYESRWIKAAQREDSLRFHSRGRSSAVIIRITSNISCLVSLK
jgi:hypothetical protein